MKRFVIAAVLALCLVASPPTGLLAESDDRGASPEEKAPVTPRLAVLMYHEVDDRFKSAFTVTPAHLESQIQMLKDEGYAFYTLTDVERLLAGEPGLPEKGVLLTFDDGYQSFAYEVADLAAKYDVPAVSFMIGMYADRSIIFGRPHMATVEMKKVSGTKLALAGHSYDAHRSGMTEEGYEVPVLTSPIVGFPVPVPETREAYEARVLLDFERMGGVLRRFGFEQGARHFAFPFTARTETAVALGQKAGFQYFYVGGERLVTPGTDPTAIPRIHAGAPDITADVLKERLQDLFAQP